MNQFNVQSIVYICIGVDSEILNLKGEIVGDRVFDGGYECADGCPGGMLETTYWAMNDAFPILKKVANGREEEMAGSEWLYIVCEEFGRDIIGHVKQTGIWPDDNILEELAKAAINKVEQA